MRRSAGNLHRSGDIVNSTWTCHLERQRKSERERQESVRPCKQVTIGVRGGPSDPTKPHATPFARDSNRIEARRDRRVFGARCTSRVCFRRRGRPAAATGRDDPPSTEMKNCLWVVAEVARERLRSEPHAVSLPEVRLRANPRQQKTETSSLHARRRRFTLQTRGNS